MIRPSARVFPTVAYDRLSAVCCRGRLRHRGSEVSVLNELRCRIGFEPSLDDRSGPVVLSLDCDPDVKGPLGLILLTVLTGVYDGALLLVSIP